MVLGQCDRLMPVNPGEVKASFAREFVDQRIVGIACSWIFPPDPDVALRTPAKKSTDM